MFKPIIGAFATFAMFCYFQDFAKNIFFCVFLSASIFHLETFGAKVAKVAKGLFLGVKRLFLRFEKNIAEHRKSSKRVLIVFTKPPFWGFCYFCYFCSLGLHIILSSVCRPCFPTGGDPVNYFCVFRIVTGKTPLHLKVLLQTFAALCLTIFLMKWIM